MTPNAQPNLPTPFKRVVKVITFYEDGTFTEHIPAPVYPMQPPYNFPPGTTFTVTAFNEGGTE